MSQNDFNLANQGFPSMRSDMNSALQALASNSAGATEPSTTYAYQWWYDETTDILKMRNADNDAWISFATFDQATDTFTITTDNIDGLTATATELNKLDGVTNDAASYFTASGALSNRNLIINGAMQVAQRGTSSTAANYQTVDRWRNSFGGVSLTQSQESLTSGDPFDAGFRSYLRLTQSSSSSAATDFAQILQCIEGLNAATSSWNYKSSSSYMTASFWVRSSLAGTYYIYMQTRSNSGDGYINAPFTVSANTWTKVVVSFPGNASINIDNDNSSGIELRIVPYFGTDYTSSSISSNTWYFTLSGGELPDFAQNWCATAGATFDLTGVQLEVGDTATPFEHRSYGQELALCQRYYSKSYDPGVLPAANDTAGILQALSNTLGVFSESVRFPVFMRAAPTITLYNPTGGSSSLSVGSTVGAGGFFASETGGTTNSSTRFHYVAQAEL